MTERARKLLQSVDLEARPEVEGLYFTTDEARVLDRPSIDHRGLSIPAGCHVSFDCYFNAFFENYWFRYTVLRSVVLELTLVGTGEVTLWRQTPDRDVYLLDRRPFDGEGAVEFRIDDDDELRAEAGRIWFEIETTAASTLCAGGWVSDATPARDVALAAVFCTFNRQTYLQRLLRAIDSHENGVASVERIFVVNQGAEFSAEAIVGDGSTGRVLSKLEIIEQPNMGGCGGFTRGMRETLNDDGLTHFVLMDDDSRVHPDSLVRVASFLSYAHDDVVVGGHMLNLHRPNILFEAGAELDHASLQPKPVHHGADLCVREGLERFLRAAPVEYNGWWFFAADKRVLEEIGFPMPCFIRGDDIEYGMRLRRSGKLTVPMPGVAVWHEPFYLKLGGWQFFFEVRNRLAAAALHDAGSWKGIRRDLLAVFARDIAMSRYHSAKLMIEGIEAYCAGPDVALVTHDGPLQAARKIVAELGPERLEHVGGGNVAEPHGGRPPGELRLIINNVRTAAARRVGRAALAWQILRRVASKRPTSDPSGTVIRAAQLVPFRVAAHDDYVVVEEHGSHAWHYRRDPTLERELWREFVPLLRSIGPDERYRNVHEQSGRFSEHWHRIFGDLCADPSARSKT